MYIQPNYVSFETSKLLKEKNFNLKVNSQYGVNYDWNKEKLKGKPKLAIKEIDNYNSTRFIKGCSYSAPEQWLVAKWLRNIYKIHITITSVSQESWMYRITKPGQPLVEGFYGEDFETYEQALEDAILYTLNNLI